MAVTATVISYVDPAQDKVSFHLVVAMFGIGFLISFALLMRDIGRSKRRMRDEDYRDFVNGFVNGDIPQVMLESRWIGYREKYFR